MATDSLFNSAKPTVFFGLLLKSIDQAKIDHLATKSYSEHIALQKYYDEAQPIIDEIVEVYQGWKAIRINLEIPQSDYMNPMHLMKDVCDNINKYRQSLKDCLPIQGLLDTLEGLVYRVMYLLSLS